MLSFLSVVNAMLRLLALGFISSTEPSTTAFATILELSSTNRTGTAKFLRLATSFCENEWVHLNVPLVWETQLWMGIWVPNSVNST